MRATIKKAPKTSVDPKKATCEKIRDSIVQILKKSKAGEAKIDAVIEDMGFTSLATMNSKNLSKQRQFVEKLFDKVPPAKLKKLKKALSNLGESYMYNKANSFDSIIQECLRQVLIESPEAEDMAAALFSAEPEEAGKVILSLQDEILSLLAPQLEEEEPVGDEVQTPVNEGRWMKLAGLLKS